MSPTIQIAYSLEESGSMSIYGLPAVEAVEGGEGDVGAVELEEGEELGAEFLDSTGV